MKNIILYFDVNVLQFRRSKIINSGRVDAMKFYVYIFIE